MAGDTVNVPFLGDQKKEYLIAGGAVAIGYLVYRRFKGASASAATGAAGATATSTGLGTFAGYDATGAPVYTNAAGATVDANGNPDTVVTPVGVGGSGYSNPAPITVSGTQDTGAGSAPTTDQAWTQAVVQDLTGLAYDPQAVSTAIALYLNSQPLDTTQQMMIRTAWAYEGRPPQHPNLPIVPVQSPPTTGGGGGTTTTLPTVKPGMSLSVPYNVAPGQMAATAAKFGISEAHLLSVNPGKTGNETTTVVVNVPYLTTSADSLASLAAKFGISEQHMAQYIPAS